MDRVVGYLRMMRIRDWIRFYLFFPLLGGFICVGLSYKLAGIVAVFFCATAYGFVVNNYYDVDIDRQHMKKQHSGTNPLAAGVVTRNGTRGMMALLVATACALAVVMSLQGLLATIICLLALTLYSARPFRLKDRVFVDIVTHGLMFGGLPFIAGYLLAGGSTVPATGMIWAVALLSLIVCSESLIAHQINDYAEDSDTTDTTVVRFGPRAGWSLLLFCMVASLGVLAYLVLGYPVPLPAMVVGTAFLIAYPVYSCSDGVRTGARSAYDRVIVASLQVLR
jgi:4-hydroxybenzoate polyprenyltransferase